MWTRRICHREVPEKSVPSKENDGTTLLLNRKEGKNGLQKKIKSTSPTPSKKSNRYQFTPIYPIENGGQSSPKENDLKKGKTYFGACSLVDICVPLFKMTMHSYTFFLVLLFGIFYQFTTAHDPRKFKYFHD